MNHRILIVEDSSTQALRAQLLLEETGYQVSTASNGLIGLEKARSNPPDLVVADLMMPVMDGYEMTRQLKSDPLTAGVPVLMLTTKDQPLDIIRGLEAGADQFLTKPYDDDYLVERIQALLGQLAEARAGRSPEQQELASFSQDIVITKSREQILQMLLQATARILACEAMGLLLHSQDEWPTISALVPHTGRSDGRAPGCENGPSDGRAAPRNAGVGANANGTDRDQPNGNTAHWRR